MLCHIVAVSENNVIGSHNTLPWRLPVDLKYFKNKTWGMPVIMGRNTYESMKKSLAGRINIIITNKKNFYVNDAFVVNSIEAAIEAAKATDVKEIFIIGGGEIFRQTIGQVSKIYCTRIHAKVDGDTFYPELNINEWHLTSQHSFAADEKNNYDYTFEVWEKNNAAS